ncbi:hypothetical protein Tco_1489172, partial [Tanacetum coccineum]
MQEVILFYNRLGIPTRQILDSRGAIPSKTVADANVAIQEMAEYCQKWHNGTSRSRSTETSDGLAAIQAQLNNLRIEIKKNKGKLSKKLTTRNLVDLFKEGDIEQQLRYSIKERMRILRTKNEEIRALTDAAIQNQGSSIKTLEIQIGQMSKLIHARYAILDLPNTPKDKDPGSELAHTKLTVELADRTVKFPKGIAENVLV